MHGAELIEALKETFAVQTKRQLAERIGGSAAVMQIIERLNTVSPRRVCGLVARARQAAARNWITEIAEFHPIHKTESGGRKRWEILNREDVRHKPLIRTLEDEVGIYLFYDSMGRVIYVGKTKSSLWREMKNAFNRKNVANVVSHVRYPTRSRHAGSKRAQRLRIKRYILPLHETAAFFSAYRVDGPFIDQVEALFIRAIPNNLINLRIEGQT